jgi:hypothetical protein
MDVNKQLCLGYTFFHRNCVLCVEGGIVLS